MRNIGSFEFFSIEKVFYTFLKASYDYESI